MKTKLLESKQVGRLYHVCTPESLLYNLKHNVIKPGESPNYKKSSHGWLKSISFTRSKTYYSPTVRLYIDVFYQIVLNGDLISESYPIQPYVDLENDWHGEQFEEVIFFKEGEFLADLDKYIIEINLIVLAPTFNMLEPKALELIKQKRIPFNIIEKDDALLPATVNNLDTLIKYVYFADKEYLFSYTAKKVIQGLLHFIGYTEDDKRTGVLKTYINDNREKPNINVNNKDIKQIIKEIINYTSEFLYDNNVKYVVTTNKSNSSLEKRAAEKKIMTVLDNKTYLVEMVEFDYNVDIVSFSEPKLTIYLRSKRGSLITVNLYMQPDFTKESRTLF